MAPTRVVNAEVLMNGPDPFLKVVADHGTGCRCDEASEAFCAGLTPDGLKGLRTIRGNLKAEAQETVFREGDPAEYVYTLVSGTIKLSKLLGDGRRQIVGFRFPGDFFGFSPDMAYGYTAEAVAPTQLCRFSETRLMQLLQSNPDLEHRLLGRMVAELHFAQDQMLLLGRMTAREKLSHFLLMLSRRAALRGAALSPVALPMSRLDVADYLGLTIETVSRTLTTLKKSGAIALSEPGLVDLLDIDRLKSIAEGQAAD